MEARKRVHDVYCYAVGLAAVGLAVVLALRGPMPELVPVVIFGALLAFAVSQSVLLFPGAETSADFMLVMAAVIVFREEGALLGPVLVGMFSGIDVEHLRHREFEKISFNLGSYALATFAAALVFWAAPDAVAMDSPSLALIGLTLVGALAFFLVSCMLLSVVLALSPLRQRVGQALPRLLLLHLQGYPFALLGAFLGVLYIELGPVVVPLFVAPIFVARQVFASYQELKRSHEATVRILIRALEAKDRYTAGHAERVARFAQYIGVELGFTPSRLERLRLAALMHDVGKLVVPNHLLNKPGKLTAEEFDRVRQHEDVSVEILTRIDFLAPVAPSAVSEFTRFSPVADERGQPIEPHIVAVADAFDAMTSTRSYRKALAMEVAFSELRDKAGSQFHPRCVEALISAIERRAEQYGSGHEEDVDDWATPPPIVGTGSAGLGDLLPDAIGATRPRSVRP